MRVHMKLKGDRNYSAKINGALAGWDNKDARLSYLTLFGYFPMDGVMVEQYTIHFRTEIGFSICKKLEKEGMADLATDYIRGFVVSEEWVDEG